MPRKTNDKDEKEKLEKKSKSKTDSKSKSVKTNKVDSKKESKTSAKSKAVKAKSTKKDKEDKLKTTSKAKSVKTKAASKSGRKSVRANSASKKVEKVEKTVKNQSSRVNTKENSDLNIDNNESAKSKQSDSKAKEKKKKVKELRETLIQVLNAYDEAAMKVTGSKTPPKLDKGIQLDDKTHNEVCDLAAREIGQESRSYKEYFLVVLLPDAIWDEIEKAEEDLSITKLKELAKAYNRNEIDQAKLLEIFKDMLENNLTTAAVKEKIKSA